MKKRIAVLILLIALLFPSCTTDISDCVCTTEFVTHSIIVVDSSGDPVDSLITRITNSSGRELTSHGSYFTSGRGGRYWIMDDSYKNELTNRPTTIFFDGTKENVIAEAAFLINTDECKCHVNKVAGPDTVVAQ